MIRDVLGIRKRVAVSIGHRERPRRIGFGSRPHQMPTLAARIGANEAAYGGAANGASGLPRLLLRPILRRMRQRRLSGVPE